MKIELSIQYQSCGLTVSHVYYPCNSSDSPQSQFTSLWQEDASCQDDKFPSNKADGCFWRLWASWKPFTWGPETVNIYNPYKPCPALGPLNHQTPTHSPITPYSGPLLSNTTNHWQDISSENENLLSTRFCSDYIYTLQTQKVIIRAPVPHMGRFLLF